MQTAVVLVGPRSISGTPAIIASGSTIHSYLLDQTLQIPSVGDISPYGVMGSYLFTIRPQEKLGKPNRGTLCLFSSGPTVLVVHTSQVHVHTGTPLCNAVPNDLRILKRFHGSGIGSLLFIFLFYY